VRLPLLINFSSFVVNAILNWILIYGKFGAPAMGIRGSATATLCARILELIMALTYAYAFDKTLKLRFRYIFKTDKQLLHDFLHYSAPVVANETLWSVGISLQSVVIGHIGSQEVAANSIAGVVQRLGMVMVFGMANSAAVIVGKQIGAGNQKKAQEYAHTILLLSVALGIVAAFFILSVKNLMVDFYSVDEVTKTYARQIIQVYAIVIMFQAFNTVNIVGILRGGGDTRFAMFIAGFYFKLPFPWVFFLLMSDECVKFFIGIWRFRTGKWLCNVTR
jgi:putative MATE family efflux protein